jgi:hypothetical protein
MYHAMREEWQKEIDAVLQMDCVNQVDTARLRFWLTHRDPGLKTWHTGRSTFATATGEVLVEYECARMYVEAAEVEQCYLGVPVHFINPVANHTSLWFVEPLTHRLTPNGVEIECNAQFPGKYQNYRGEWFVVHPARSLTAPPDNSFMPRDRLQEYQTAPDWSQMGIYDDEALLAVHLYQEQDRTILESNYDSLIELRQAEIANRHYLTGTKLPPDWGSPPSPPWWSSPARALSSFWDFAERWGATASVIMFFLTLFQLIFALLKFIWSFKILKEVEGCANSLLYTLCAQIFLLREHRRYRRSGWYQAEEEEQEREERHRKRLAAWGGKIPEISAPAAIELEDAPHYTPPPEWSPPREPGPESVPLLPSDEKGRNDPIYAYPTRDLKDARKAEGLPSHAPSENLYADMSKPILREPVLKVPETMGKWMGRGFLDMSQQSLVTQTGGVKEWVACARDLQTPEAMDVGQESAEDAEVRGVNEDPEPEVGPSRSELIARAAEYQERLKQAKMQPLSAEDTAFLLAETERVGFHYTLINEALAVPDLQAAMVLYLDLQNDGITRKAAFHTVAKQTQGRFPQEARLGIRNALKRATEVKRRESKREGRFYLTTPPVPEALWEVPRKRARATGDEANTVDPSPKSPMEYRK